MEQRSSFTLSIDQFLSGPQSFSHVHGQGQEEKNDPEYPTTAQLDEDSSEADHLDYMWASVSWIVLALTNRKLLQCSSSIDASPPLNPVPAG